ncbi:MAG: chromosome segregation protein SMC [Cytophagaceae bacterium]
MAEEKKKTAAGNRKGLIIAFIIVLLSINGIQLFFNYNQRQELENKDLTIQEKDVEIAGTLFQLDSVRTQLEISRNRIAELGGKVDELDAMIAQLETDKAKLTQDASSARRIMREYKEKAEGYVDLLKASDVKIKQLTEQRDALFAQNQGLEKKVQAKDDSIQSLTMSRKELAHKVAMASTLQAENIQIEAVTPKNKIKDGEEIRAKYIHKLRVKFNIGDNKIAKHEGKDIFMRLIEPDGTCLFDMNTGGGTFMAEGKETVFTDKRTILFANKNERVNFDYIKGSDYKLGKHRIEIYSDGFKIGEAEFIVK